MMKVSKIKQVLLSVAVAIIFVLFVGYGINTFYEEPRYNDYCDEDLYKETIDTQLKCEALGGEWEDHRVKTYAIEDNQLLCDKISESNGSMNLNCRTNGNDLRESGWCNVHKTCSENFHNEREGYNKNVFIIAVLIGLATLAVGGIFLNVESIGSGLMGGSVLTILYGTIRYWGNASDILRFVMLGAVLATLIWLGYTKLNPRKAK